MKSVNITLGCIVLLFVLFMTENVDAQVVTMEPEKYNALQAKADSVDTLKKQLAEQQAKLMEMETELTAQTKNAADLEKANQEAAKRIREYQQNEDAVKDFEGSKALWEREKAELEQENKRLEEERDDKIKELGTVERERNQLKRENSQLRDKQENNAARLDAMEAEVGKVKQLKAEVQTKEGVIQKLQREKQSEVEKVKQLNATVRTKEREIQKLQQQMRDKESEVQQLNATVQTQEEEIQKLQQQMRDKESEVQQLNATVQTKEREIAELEKEIGPLRTENEALRPMVFEKVERSVTALTQRVDYANVNTELSRKLEEVRELKKSNPTYATTYGGYEKKLRDYQKLVQAIKTAQLALSEKYNKGKVQEAVQALTNSKTFTEEQKKGVEEYQKLLRAYCGKYNFIVTEVQDMLNFPENRRAVIAADNKKDLNPAYTFLRKHLTSKTADLNKLKDFVTCPEN